MILIWQKLALALFTFLRLSVAAVGFVFVYLKTVASLFAAVKRATD